MSEAAVDKSKTAGLTRTAANIFSSVRLAIALITLIALICAAGTFFPQLKPYSFYRDYYGGYINIIYLFSLNDIYHSFIFYFAVTLLCFNISVCSLRRLKARLHALRGSGAPKDAEYIMKLKYTRSLMEFDSNGLAVFENKLKSAGYKLYKSQEADGVSGFAESGRHFFAGEQLVHLSIIVIIAGAMIGNIFGYKTYARLYPGDALTVNSRQYQALRGEMERMMEVSRETGIYDHVTMARLLKESEAVGDRELFSLKIKDFKTEYFTGAAGTDEAGTRVKNWNTYFTLIDEGREKFSGVIAVNSPLSYKGVDIYQSSYYKSQDKIKKLKIKASYPAGAHPAESEILEFNDIGDEKPMRGGEIKLRLASFVPDFRFDSESREIYSAGDMAYNPAVKFIISSGQSGETKQVWLFKNIERFADTILKDLNYDFKLDIESLEVLEREASGLQINYDPGVNIVWLGCFLITCGLFMSFNISHKRIWYSFSASRKCLIAGGISNKDGPDFSAGFARIFDKLE